MIAGSLWQRPKLLIPAVCAPVAETGVLLALRARAAAALGPQVTAPPPFDVFHDLRWVSVYHNGWLVFAAEVVAVLTLRAAYAAWLVQQAWPDGREPPGMPFAFVRALAFYAVAMVVMVPWVVLMFGFGFSGLSWLYLAALPPVLGIALVLHRGALAQAAGRLWDWRPRLHSAVWVLGAFLYLSIAGAVISRGPAAAGVATAAVAGLLNAAAVRSIVSGIALHPQTAPRLRERLAVPVSLAAIFAVVVGGAVAGFADAQPPPPDRVPVRIPARLHAHPVLVVSGFNSTWSRSQAFPPPAGFEEWRFSYRGLRNRRFLPYRPADTLQPIPLSARRLAAQVTALHRASGSPVAIVAESEGAWVTRYYLTQLYRPPSRTVDRVALLDMPPVDPAVYYPQRTNGDGWGVASGWGLRGLTTLVEHLGPLKISADAPMLRRFADCPALSARVLGGPAPAGVHEVAFLALGDAVDGTSGAPAGTPAYVIDAPHGGLIHVPAVQRGLRDVLTGRDPAIDTARLHLVSIVGAVSDAWHTPGLVAPLGPDRRC